MHIGTNENRFFSREVFIQQGIDEQVGFFFIEVEVVHAVFLRSDFRLVMCKGQGVCRDVDFGNDVHTILYPHALKFGKLLLGIRAVLGGQAREAFTFQSEGSVGLVPIIIEELWETIVIQVNLEFVHLVERKHLDLLLQVIEGKELASHIEHKATIRKFRPVACCTLRQLRFLTIEHLQKGSCSPEYTLSRGRLDAYLIYDA